MQGQGHCGFWILATKFLLVSLSNNGSISHRLGAIGVYSCTWRRKVTQGQRSRCTSTDQDIRNIFVNRHHRLRASFYPLCAIFNFRDLEMTLKSHPRSKVMTHFNYVGHEEHSFAIGTYGLQATVWPIRAIFTFVTSKWPLKRSCKVKVIANSESLVSSSY